MSLQVKNQDFEKEKRLSITEEKSFLQKQASFAILYHMKKRTNKMVQEVQTIKVIHQNIARFSIQIVNKDGTARKNKLYRRQLYSTIRRQIWQIFDPSPPKTCRRFKWMVPCGIFNFFQLFQRLSQDILHIACFQFILACSETFFQQFLRHSNTLQGYYKVSDT